MQMFMHRANMLPKSLRRYNIYSLMTAILGCCNITMSVATIIVLKKTRGDGQRERNHAAVTMVIISVIYFITSFPGLFTLLIFGDDRTARIYRRIMYIFFSLDCVWVGLGPRGAVWLVFGHRTWCYWTIRSHFTGIRNRLSLQGLLSVFELVSLDCVLECVMVGLGEQDGWCLGTELGATGLSVPILLGYVIVFRYQVNPHWAPPS